MLVLNFCLYLSATKRRKTSTNRGHSTNYYANGHLHIADIVQAKAFLDSTYNPSTSRITLTFINWGACFFKRKKKNQKILCLHKILVPI